MFAQDDKSAIMSFFDKWGNAASVVGLCITLIGFGLTLWSIWRVRTITRETIRRMGMQMLSVNTTGLMHRIGDLREAGTQQHWPRAIERGRTAREIAITLSHSPHLLQTERDELRKMEDDLRLVVQYIENYRLPPGSPAENLPVPKQLILDRMISKVGAIQGRLQVMATEV